MAVAALLDAPADALLDALEGVREVPAPLGLVPSRLGVLARVSVEARGVYLRDLHRAEQDGEHVAAGARSVADLLVQTAGLPVWQARSDAAAARRLGSVPGLLDALAGGGVEEPAARLVARAWSALPDRLRDQPTARALISLAGLVDLADLKAKVDELLAALQPEVTDDALASAHDARALTMVRVGGESRLDGHGDAVEGEWLWEVLQAKAESDRVDGDPRSNGARAWDALLDCVRVAVSSPGAVPCPEDCAPTVVAIVTADDLLRSSDPRPDVVAPEEALTDLLTTAGTDPSTAAPADPADLDRDRDRGRDRDRDRDDASNAQDTRRQGEPNGTDADASPADRRRARWSARTRGGVHLGPRTLARLACESGLTRLLVDDHGLPLDSSPRSRQLSRRERRALEHRAAYRCQRLGCGRPAWACVPHHVVPYALGGLTVQSNMILLCRSCHHLLHDHQRPLELTDGSRISPTGWVRRASGAPPPRLF